MSEPVGVWTCNAGRMHASYHKCDCLDRPAAPLPPEEPLDRATRQAGKRLHDIAHRQSVDAECEFCEPRPEEPPRPSEPSADLIETALLAVAVAYGIDQDDPDDSGQDEVMKALRDLVRAAKEEALLAVARAGCRWCRSPHYEAVRQQPTSGRWVHDYPIGYEGKHGVMHCSRPEVWGALAAQREGR